MPIFENLEQFTTTNDNNNKCDINQYGQKGGEYNLQQFSIEKRLNFRINLATAIEKIQAETVEQLEALQMIKMELSSAAKC